MQLLYGNDGMSYRTIAKSAELTEQQEKKILNGYVVYDFVQDSSLYSDMSKEPVSLALVTTDLSHTLPSEKVMLVRNARMSNYLTPSYYSHVFLLDLDESILAEGFSSLLRSTFIRDSEIMKYGNDTIDYFKREANQQISIDEQALEKETMLLLVTSLLQVADSISGELKVILDVDGDRYNQRAMDVIASVYTCIPFHIRKTVGFSTYCGGGRMLSSRIKFQIYCREAARSLSGNVLDLRNLQVSQKLSALPRRLMRMVGLFVGNEAARTEWFQHFRQAFGSESASVQNHLDFFENVQSWREQRLEDAGDKWAKYAWQEQQKTKMSPAFQAFCEIVNGRFEDHGLKIRYAEILQEYIIKQDSYDFEMDFKAYLMLGEAVPVLDIPEEIFVEWQKDKIIDPIEKKYKDLDLERELSLQYKELQGKRFGKEKCDRIFNAMEAVFEKKLEAVQAEIQQHTVNEKERIENSLRELLEEPQKYVAKYDVLESLYQGIQYKKTNDEVFSQTLAKELTEYLEQLQYFDSFLEYTEYKAFADKCMTWLPEESGKLIEGLLKEKGETVEKLERYKRISWQRREDVLHTYDNIAAIRRLVAEKKIKIPRYVLVIAGQEFCFTEDKLRKLTEFLCIPTFKNQTVFLNLAKSTEGLKEKLLKVGMFREEHFTTLLKLANEHQAFGRMMVKYYANRGVLLPEECARKSIAVLKQKELENIIGNSKEKNLLTMLIRQKLGENRQVMGDILYDRDDSLMKKPTIGKRKKPPFWRIIPMVIPPLFMLLLLLGNMIFSFVVTPLWKNLISFVLGGTGIAVLCISLFLKKRNHILVGIGAGLIMALLLWQYGFTF